MAEIFRETEPSDSPPRLPELPRPEAADSREDDPESSPRDADSATGTYPRGERAAEYERVRQAVAEEYAEAMAGLDRPGPATTHGHLQHTAERLDMAKPVSEAPSSLDSTEAVADGEQPDGDRQLDDLVTRPSGELGGTPYGKPADIRPNMTVENRHSLGRENSTAVTLADNGYRIKQNPSPEEVVQARHATGDTGDPRSNPDYLLEDRVFDCYSPADKTGVRGIWRQVDKKVEAGQAQRVVVNLEGWQGNLSDLRQQFHDWPIDNLKEVKAITPQGDVVQIIPDQRSV